MAGHRFDQRQLDIEPRVSDTYELAEAAVLSFPLAAKPVCRLLLAKPARPRFNSLLAFAGAAYYCCAG
jgi:hypothetical protein